MVCAPVRLSPFVVRHCVVIISSISTSKPKAGAGRNVMLRRCTALSLANALAQEEHVDETVPKPCLSSVLQNETAEVFVHCTLEGCGPDTLCSPMLIDCP